MKAMLLAAGRGQRMQPLSDKTPKPLLMAGKYRLIEHNLLALANSGITDIIINVAYQAKQIISTLGDGDNYGVNIKYSIEKIALDTGGGIVNALPLLGNEPFIVINSDLYTNFPYKKLLLAKDYLAHLVLVDNPKYHQEGDFCLDNNIITLNKPKLTFAGIGIYSPKLFINCRIEKFSLASLLFRAIAQQKITGEYFQGVWQNIGTMKQLADLQDMLAHK